MKGDHQMSYRSGLNLYLFKWTIHIAQPIYPPVSEPVKLDVYIIYDILLIRSKEKGGCLHESTNPELCGFNKGPVA